MGKLQKVVILAMFLFSYLFYRCQGPWVECQSPKMSNPRDPLSLNVQCTEPCRTKKQRRKVVCLVWTFFCFLELFVNDPFETARV
jgi:hypothetical protein